MFNDIEIAQKAKIKKISKIAKNKLGIPDNEIHSFGHFKAKIKLSYLKKIKRKKE